MSGWIKLHRSICQNDYWQSEPFDRARAWIDLLLLANHRDGFIRVRGIRVDVPRGSVGWSEVSLAERWKWSRGKVRRFLGELETVQQIVQQKNALSSVIAIVNYDKYQDDDTANGTADGQQTVQQTVQQTDTNKNDKNEKNEKKDIDSDKSESCGTDWDLIQSKWNAEIASLSNSPKLQAINKARQAKVRSRMAETGKTAEELLDAIRDGLTPCAAFVRDGGWFGFDWAFKSPQNLAKLIEGNYRDKPALRYEAQHQPNKYDGVGITVR